MTGKVRHERPLVQMRHEASQDRVRVAFTQTGRARHAWLTRRIASDLIECGVRWIEENVLHDAGPNPADRAELFADLYEQSTEVIRARGESSTQDSFDVGLVESVRISAVAGRAVLGLVTPTRTVAVDLDARDLLGVVRGLLEISALVDWEIPRPELVLVTEIAQSFAQGLIYRHRRTVSR